MVVADDRTLKSRIARGEFFIGGQVPLNATEREFDYVCGKSEEVVWTSFQHVVGGRYTELEQMARWAEKNDVELVVRLSNTDVPDQALDILDRGASGITIPQIENEEQILAVGKKAFYPALADSPNYGGARSGGGRGRIGNPLEMGMEYFPWVNERISIGAQIESFDAAECALIFAKAHLVTTASGANGLEDDIEHKPMLTYLDFGPWDFRVDVAYRLQHLPKSLTNEEVEHGRKLVDNSLPQSMWIRHMDYWVDSVVDDLDGLPTGVVMRDSDRVPFSRWVDNDGSEYSLERLSDLRSDLVEDYRARGLSGVWFNPLHEKNYIPELNK